jgi:hypothetical protein
MPGLGRRPAVDPRNAAHPMRRLLAEVPPVLPVPDLKTWDFRGYPLDQGNTGTCTAHAAAHFIHSAPLSHRGFMDPFALYREIVLLDEWTDNDREAQGPISGMQGGSSGTGAAKALEKRGLISEYLWAAEMRDAILWLLTRGPVMVGSNWYSSMFTATKEGFVKITQAASIAGGHEWILRAADTRRAVCLGVNSWGADWNRDATGLWVRARLRPGQFLIDFGTLERLFLEDGDAVSAIERRAA